MTEFLKLLTLDGPKSMNLLGTRTALS